MREREMPQGWVEFVRQLGDAITSAREARGISQEEAARIAGVTRHTYQRFEKGWQSSGTPNNPTLQTVLAICWALGVRIEEVLPPIPPRMFEDRGGFLAARDFSLEGPKLEPRGEHEPFGRRLT